MSFLLLCSRLTLLFFSSISFNLLSQRVEV